MKDFVITFAENKGITMDQLISIEIGQKLKYVYLDGNSVHMVEEFFNNGTSNE